MACRLENLDLLDIILSQESYPAQNLNIMSQTLLQVACLMPDLKVAKHLVKNSKKYVYKISDDINLIDHFTGLTLIQIAYKTRNRDLFDFLLTVPGLNLEVKNKDRETLLHFMCRDYCEEFAESCLMKCSKTSCNKEGNTPLHIAAIAKNKSLLMRLLNDLSSLSKKLDTNVNKRGLNLLHFVATMDDMLDVIDLIVSKGIINPFSENPFTGDTPLHDACDSGKLKNALYLVKLLPDDRSWYNNNGESPLCKAIEKYHFDFLDNLVKKCPLSRLNSCIKFSRVPKCILFSPSEPVEIPYCLYLIYKFLIHTNSKTSRVDDSIDEAVNMYNPLSGLVDSQENTLLHYLAMVKWNNCLDAAINRVFADETINVNSLNKCSSAPLHHACMEKNDKIIMNILKHSAGVVSLNKESIHGLPIEQYIVDLDVNTVCGAVDYLIAHGANTSKLQNYWFRDSDKVKEPIVWIFVLGNSGVGKTSLVGALKFRLTGKCSYVANEPTMGLEKSEVEQKNFYFEFNDFGGHPEFEVSHSLVLQSCLSSALHLSAQNTFIFLLVVKGTDTEQENKEQIELWIHFVCSHKIDKTVTLHVILICSHADCFGNDILKSERLGVLKNYLNNFNKGGAYFLTVSDICICLYCQLIDATPLEILLNYIDDCSTSLTTRKLSIAAASLETILRETFNSYPLRIKQFMDKLQQCEKYEIRYNKIDHLCDYHGIIPCTVDGLVKSLEELHCHISISVLKHDEKCCDWWIVSKDMECVFFKYAVSLFSPDSFKNSPKYPSITSNTGVVSILDLDRIIKSWNLEVPDTAIIDYLVSMEFCKPINNEVTKYYSENASEKQHFFFPGLIKSDKGKDVYYVKTENVNECSCSGWSMKTNSRLGLKFLHSLLLCLTFKFVAVGASESIYDRRVTLWKNGLSWCTDDQIEILVEVRADREVIVLCRSYSHDNDSAPYSLAMHKSSVIQEVQKIMKQNGLVVAIENILYPPPTDYASVKGCSQIEVGDIMKFFKKELAKRCIYLEQESIHIQEILGFDPYVDFHAKSIKLFRSNDRILEDKHFPTKVITFFRKHDYEVQEITYNKCCSILDTFSIFNAEDLANSVST